MPSFTTDDVRRLRELTQAGMMDCKKALQQTDGDFDKAVEFLRIKGAKDIGKRAGRTTANGLVAHHGNSLLELNCETDFVAKNADFIALGQTLAKLVDETKPADLAALLATKLPDGRTVAETVNATSATIGEKLVVNRFGTLSGSVAVYLHRKSPDLPPQVGVAVQYQVKPAPAGQPARPEADVEADARRIAMQIASMRPKWISRDDVPEELVAAERRIAEETVLKEGKPAAVVPKIVEGRINEFYKDFVLLEQAWVVDPKKTIRQVLTDGGIEVAKFIHFEVGRD